VESLRMILIFCCSVGAISKVCGKGGNSIIVFRLSIDRHFLGPVRWPSILCGQSQPLKEFGFAFCIRRAASVSLMAAATLFSASC